MGTWRGKVLARVIGIEPSYEIVTAYAKAFRDRDVYDHASLKEAGVSTLQLLSGSAANRKAVLAAMQEGNFVTGDASIGVLSISIILLAPPLFLTGILTQDSEVLRLSSVMTIIDAAVVTSAILASRNTHNSHTLRPAQDDS